MKNKLLVTTALVALMGIGNVYANDTETKSQIVVAAGSEQSLSGEYSGYNTTGDGGAIFNSGTITSLTGKFIGNTATPDGVNSGRGGAIYNTGTSKIKNITAVFEGNAADKGGAISNAGTGSSGEITISGSEFNSNTATTSGGAIHNMSKGIMNISGSHFNGNTANNNGATLSGGGAIYNLGQLEVSDTDFSGNEANYGGAILNVDESEDEATRTIKNSTFSGNTAKVAGGAILNISTVADADIMNIENSTFSDNTALLGGAIYNTGTMNMGGNLTSQPASMKIVGSTFSDNTATQKGGAIYNGGDMTIDSGSVFTSNSAQYGGAIYTEGTMTVADATFDGNSATQNGGAIYNRGGTLTVTNGTFQNNNTTEGDGGAIINALKGTIDNITGVFTNNTASNRGGAIYNSNGSTIDNITATFEGNTADKGGAISNAGTVNIADSTFKNNISTNKDEGVLGGGAIHNMAGAIINFSGSNVFEGNKANGQLNDIYNNGTINVKENSHLTLDGGISEHAAEDGKIVFEDKTTLTVNSGTTTISNDVTLNGTTNLEMIIANGTDKYELIEGSLLGDGEFVIQGNNLYDIEAIEGELGSYSITKKSSDEIAASTGANSNQTSAISAIASVGAEGSEAFNTVANDVTALLQSSDKSQVQAGLDAVTAMAPEVAPMVQQNQTQIANQIYGAVGTRLSGGSIATGGQGMSSGDGIFERAAMWVQTMFNKAKLDDTSKAKGFDSDTTGIAMGAEKYIDSKTKLGLGYAYSNSDIDGFMRSTDVDTHTAFVYGEYKPSNWYVNGIASYGWSDYSEDKNVAGHNVSADYDATTFGLQAMTGYDMQMSNFGLTPEIGLRYAHISQDSYKDSIGQSVSGNDSDILTGVIGAKVSKAWKLDNGMNLKPEARVAMTYDLMNDDANSVVTLANGTAYVAEGEALDRFGMEFGAGVTAEVNDKVELSVAYEGRFREDYQDHTGLLSAKYKF